MGKLWDEGASGSGSFGMGELRGGGALGWGIDVVTVKDKRGHPVMLSHCPA